MSVRQLCEAKDLPPAPPPPPKKKGKLIQKRNIDI